jgi:transposase
MDPAQQEAKRQAAKQKRLERAAQKRQLPQENIIHDIDKCPHCQGTQLLDLATAETSDEVEYIPAHFIRRHHIRPKKKCRDCERIITATTPERVTDGCHYGPGLHAHAVVSKCADALPIHRLCKRFARDGINIERSTLNRMFHRTAELLSPIAQRILELVAQSERVNADETPIFIQAPEKCRKGYVWTFLAENLIAYVFSSSRSGQTPKNVLKCSQGSLQVDRFTGYNVVCMPNGRQRISCLAHIRRKFFNALKTAPDDAQEALDRILSLYEVEYEAAQLNIIGTVKHLAMRRTLTKERLEAFDAWM